MLQGHEENKTLIKKVKTQSFLFVGPERVGRRQLARWYAALLNCQTQSTEPCGTCQSCQMMTNSEHPDYKELSPERTTSTGRANRKPELKIAQLVQRKDSTDTPLTRWLESAPSFKTKVGVIDDAHTLNLSAANAFLKTLEEPPSNSKIILIAPSPEAVIATLASRTTLLRFSPSATVAQENAHPLARLGRLGDTHALIGTEDNYELLTNYINALPKTLEEAFEAADNLEKNWEANPNMPDLLSSQLSQLAPTSYAKAYKALERFEASVAAYSSVHLAMHVLTLDLRKALEP